MKLRRIVLLSLSALVATVTVAGPADPASATHDRDASSYLQEWQDENGLRGVAAAVIDDGTAEVMIFGEDGDGNQMASTTPFLTGSVAKTFTASLVQQLVDQERLTLDGSARSHLSWLEHDATVRQLLDHTAGYSAADGLAVSEHYREDLTVTGAAMELRHSGEIGDYAYSSANYLVLGAVIESVTGRGFGEVLEESILEPIGMTSTGLDDDADEVPPGSRSWWGASVAYDPASEPSGAPYGYLVSTLDDLVGYAQAHLNGEIVSGSSQQDAWSDESGTGYGLGWRVDDSDGTTRIHHTGATPGFFSHIMLMPEVDRAVIVLANGYSEAKASSLAAAAVDLDTVTQGGESTPKGADPLLTALPWLALVPLLGALGAAAAVVFRPLRRRGLAIAVATGSVALAIALALVPSLLGMTWHVVRVWTPDVAAGLASGVAMWSIVAILALLSRRRLPLAERGDSAADASSAQR